MSQSIENTLFLEDCISRKRKLEDIYESLGLFIEKKDARKEPVFVKDGADELHKRVKEIATSFKSSYRNDRDRLVADLLKADAFAEELQELGDSYGNRLWARPESQPTMYNMQQGGGLDELFWDNVKDQNDIKFYIRCWISRCVKLLSYQLPEHDTNRCRRYAALTAIPRKGKSKASMVTHDLSEDDYSDNDTARTPPQKIGTSSSDLPFRAPEMSGALPSESLSGVGADNVQEANAGAISLNIPVQTKPYSPTTPSKRKALSFQGQSASGKLQKVVRDGRAATTSPQQRQRDVYSGPRSPTSTFPEDFTGLAHSDFQERTLGSNGMRPPFRESTVESETTVMDPDQVMRETEEFLLMDIQANDISGTSGAQRSPTAGPSGTYQNPLTQDSVIPSNTQDAADVCRTDGSPHQRAMASSLNPELWRPASVSNVSNDISRLATWQKRQLRDELFKLLVAYLVGIEPFKADSYDSGAEEKMNGLLYQFWVNDGDTLRLEVGDKFANLAIAFERWMGMRHLLAEFRRASKYSGRTGLDWQQYLRQLDHKAHAKAAIAFVELSRFANTRHPEGSIPTTFDSDLATLFDLLTQVKGCNGAEEFQAVQSYNKDLIEWFS
ncbi:hypothetical protein FB567DRAFT_36880 [Paraphoma chrysanthemicola]|uniref:Uncharacterized protein n=1 Tax=Paraphoma chrysanthemicola TaxID=798071 RepID=A0A8K0RKW5_9PLEO|nr:hypothetical protein FB567DRAFT_36880 [Paraphoma chrysanthemicola]